MAVRNWQQRRGNGRTRRAQRLPIDDGAGGAIPTQTAVFVRIRLRAVDVRQSARGFQRASRASLHRPSYAGGGQTPAFAGGARRRDSRECRDGGAHRRLRRRHSECQQHLRCACAGRRVAGADPGGSIRAGRARAERAGVRRAAGCMLTDRTAWPCSQCDSRPLPVPSREGYPMTPRDRWLNSAPSSPHRLQRSARWHRPRLLGQ